MERRKQKRVPFDVLIHCQSSQAIVEGRAEDVSLGGMSVKTEKTFPENEEIEVFFTIPGSSQGIQASVRVARLEPGSLMGLEFLNLSPESEKVIQQYLAAQSVP